MQSPRWLTKLGFVLALALGVVVAAASPAQAASLIPKRRMVFDSRNFLHYFRLSRDLRLLFGGRAEFSPPTAATTARSSATILPPFNAWTPFH